MIKQTVHNREGAMKGLLFDMDGTLLDSMNIWVNLANRYLESLGLELTGNLHNEIKAMTLHEALGHFKERFLLEEEVEQMLAATHAILAKEYRTTVEKKPHVDELLLRLKGRGHRMAVSTATHEDLAGPALAHHKLNGYFDFLQTANNTGLTKKDPGFWLEGARRLNRLPSDIVVFEDALHAIRTAKDAGMRVIAVEDQTMKKDRAAIIALADVYLTDFSEFDVAMLEDKNGV